jgi:hypothetical protein
MQGDVRGSPKKPALVGALLVGLLALPLALIIGSTLRPTVSEGQKALPYLPTSEARALSSFGSPCLRPEECEPPLGCIEVGAVGRGTCLNSQCESDSQCEPGRTCQTLKPMGEGRPVHRCIALQGERLEGELCWPGLANQADRCAPGLLCNHGWCGRPCRLQETSDCPEGFFCHESLNGPSCVPSCEARGCPQELQCARDADGISVCVQLRGTDCSGDSCPAGSNCTFNNLSFVDAGLALRQECIAPCGEGLPACPSGRVCVASQCLRTCDPQGPGTCFPEERCVHRVDLSVSLCKQVR